MLVGTLAIRDRSSGPSGSLAFEMQSARPSIIFQERPGGRTGKKRKETQKKKKQKEKIIAKRDIRREIAFAVTKDGYIKRGKEKERKGVEGGESDGVQQSYLTV